MSSGETVRRWLVVVHRYLGIATGLVLATVGFTGALLALQPDFDRLANPPSVRVEPDGSPVDEQALMGRVSAAVGGVAIQGIQLSGPHGAQRFVLRDGRTLIVEPNGVVVRWVPAKGTKSDRFFELMRVVHVGIFAGPVGRRVVDASAGACVVMALAGIVLWWKQRRWRIRWRASWTRLVFDLHNSIGVVAFVGVLLVAVTGLFLADEPALHWITHSPPQVEEALPRSSAPVSADGRDAPLGAFFAAADSVLPHERTLALRLPRTPQSSVQVVKAGPRSTGQSVVYLDQYSAEVLRVDGPGAKTRAEVVQAVDLGLHTGALAGWPGTILMAAAALALVALVATGLMWWARGRLSGLAFRR